MARPSKYKEEYSEQAYKLCLLGATDKDLANFFEVDEATINRWKEKPEFCEALKKGIRDYPEYQRKKEEHRAKRREYKKQPHIKKYNNEYLKKRIADNPKTRLRHNFSCLLRDRLKSKNKKATFEIVGYSVGDLIEHLEKQFVDGMTWENYGTEWHIDHIKPDSLFNYESPDDKEFKECWSLDNLQPLFAKDNLRKGNKYAG